MKRMHDMYALGGAILCYFVLIFVTFDLKRGVVRLLNVWDIYLFLGRLMTRTTRLFFFLLFFTTNAGEEGVKLTLRSKVN